MIKTCLSCDNQFNARRAIYKYCSNQCQKDLEYRQYIKEWLNGERTGSGGLLYKLSNHIVRYMHETYGTACSSCGWNEKHPIDGRVLTEIDHIDGDASNSKFSNLRILCPNCHSMTPTYRARNKVSKRTRNGKKS